MARCASKSRTGPLRAPLTHASGRCARAGSFWNSLSDHRRTKLQAVEVLAGGLENGPGGRDILLIQPASSFDARRVSAGWLAHPFHVPLGRSPFGCGPKVNPE